ncbi:histamine H1 receptor-like [Paramacrobiotus metropolitanus]|uniref:histamine H1 receptor-like n=1 Tax=Paramacrobiotus metropolitanus TaxID=2943436 RepID=UPI0024461F0C|nr:histamine H1 receptor-like [Paramacrobiotus metropolitanus]
MVIAAVGLNFGVLLYNFIKPRQITSFSIYLIALYLANLVFFLAARPFLMISEVYATWTLGRSMCIFYLYVAKVVSIIPVYMHVLISVNRLWAYIFPLHYRSYHTKSVALLISLAAVAWVHVFALSGFLVDILRNYRREHIPNCTSYAGFIMAWKHTEYVVDRILPLCFIVSAYTYLVIKRRQNEEGTIQLLHHNGR